MEASEILYSRVMEYAECNGASPVCVACSAFDIWEGPE